MRMKSYVKSSSVFVKVKNWFNPHCGEEADLLFFDESKSVAQVNELDIRGGTAVPVKTTDHTSFLNGRQWYECDECGADFDQFELAELKDGEYLTFV